jgi:RNA polymerase sigma-70 factor (ECF subfamily)
MLDVTTPGSPDTDEDIVRRVQAGERQLFEVLMRRHNPRVYRVARAIAGDDAAAEDIMQEAYTRAFTQIDRFEGRARFSTWLTRIAINEALGRRRSARPFTDVDLSAMKDRSSSPEELLASAQLIALVERAVAGLPEHYRVVFVLRAVEQLSVREVADCLEINEETVKTRHFRARAALKDALSEHAEALAPKLYDFHLERCDRIVARVLARLRS